MPKPPMPECHVHWAGAHKGSKLSGNNSSTVQEGRVSVINSCSEVDVIVQTEWHLVRLDDNFPAFCKGLILFHILISSHFLLLASIFEFQCFGLFSGLTCPKFMGLEPLCYSYFCAFLGLLSVTWLSHVTLCPVAVICCKMSLICTCLHIFVHICTY